jgi:hypothetical protein
VVFAEGAKKGHVGEDANMGNKGAKTKKAGASKPMPEWVKTHS